MPLLFSHHSWMNTSQILQAIALSIGLVSTLFFLVVREVFKPLHRRTPPKGKRWSLPPGPAGIPVIGNILQFQNARRDELVLMAYLSSLSQYGEMTTLHMGTKTWVVLNNARVINEIIAKRGTITHERPYMPVASGLISRDHRLVLQSSAQRAEGRRIAHHLLSGSAVKTYGQWQELESVQLLAEYLFRPQKWYLHHYRYSVSTIHRIILGERLLKSTRDLYELRRVTGEFLQSINGNIVDFFPQLARLPKMLQPWTKKYMDIGQVHYDCFRTWWEPVKEAIANGTSPPSFVRDVLLNEDTKYTGTDEEAMYLATSILAAGSDNPRMAINVFVMSALCYPDALQKAREEVDRVCGNATRLPGVDDMVAMPYLCAFLKEIMRWRPAVPIIPQHQLIQDLEFEGYLFPAGTEFLINGVSVGKDFQEPQVFRPERWLDGNEGNITQGLWHFGGGRRICVGYKVAQTQLFIALARLMYCFNYAPAGPYDDLRMRHHAPGEPFPVSVSVRSKRHECLILEEAERCHVLESAKVEF